MSDIWSEDHLEEECGVFGCFSTEDTEVGDYTYLGLLALQHRGQESAGISVSDADHKIRTEKGMGLIAQVFTREGLAKLTGRTSVGHVRYSTAGSSNIENAQPFEGHCKLGHLSMAHNGTLVNAPIIRSLMEDSGVVFQSTSDSEVILNLIARSASKGAVQSVIDAMSAVKGSYALIITLEGKLIGARDPYGIRPLCIGKKGEAWYLSSESCALDAVGAEFVRDVAPGEIVVIDEKGIHSQLPQKRNTKSTCVFEYIYFARPDSVVDEISVYEARIRFGAELYKEGQIDADLVIGVPDSGIPAALGYARASGIPFSLGFIKNHYVGRTFIHPSQEMRERAVSVKLAAVKEEVEGKRVILIDDSIVRGTTSRRLVSKMRQAGAKEVHFGVVSPPIIEPCYFGIDTPVSEELIANNMDNEAIRKEIGADSLQYLTLDGLLNALKKDTGFCLGCLTGEYPISPHQ